MFTYIFFTCHILHIYVHIYIFFTGHTLNISLHKHIPFTGHTLHNYVQIYIFFTYHTLHVSVHIYFLHRPYVAYFGSYIYIYSLHRPYIAYFCSHIFSSQAIDCIFMFTYKYFLHRPYVAYSVHIYIFFTAHTLHISGEPEIGFLLHDYLLRCSVSSQQTVSGDINFNLQNGTKIVIMATLRQNGSECFVTYQKNKYQFYASCDNKTINSSNGSRSYIMNVDMMAKEYIGTWFCTLQNRTSNYFNFTIKGKL